MAKCSYPQCQKCEYEYCIKDGDISLKSPPKKKDRRDYYKEYYQRTKGAKNSHKRANYYYINKKQTLDAIRALKKQIGQVNARIVIEALDKLETEIINK